MVKKGFILISVLLLLFLTACSSGEEKASTKKEEDGENTNGSDEPTEVHIMSHFFSATPPGKDSPIKEEIEKATNTKLEIDWVSANNYGDRFNVTLASGELPELMLVPDPFTPVFRQAADQGAFWDLSPYIDDYPNIKNGIEEIAWDLTKMNGANYVIPRPRPAEGETFFIIRKDWLDRVDMEVPTNTDELYKVMKAFKEKDPDNNGKDDTFGFIGEIGDENMGAMGNFKGIFTGVNGEWKEGNGQLTHTVFLPETRDALEYLANAYKDGLLAEDFASLQNSQAKDMFKAGKAGIINEKAGALQDYYEQIIQIEPELKFTDLLPITNINGFNPQGPGFAGGNVIPKSVPEEKMKEILAMIDRWMEDDVFILHKQGIEGIHHQVEDGEVVIDTEKMEKDAVGDFNQIVYVSDPYASSTKPTFPEDAQKLYEEIQDERAKTSVPNIGMGLYSEKGNTYLPEFRKKVQDLKTKIILGKEPITAWDDLVEQLKDDADMKTLTEEINESYQARES
ncbi:putative ABC transporter peptide-binding protein YtcQ [Bacillus sp. J14TS2]|uniref:extracellular solute-binding protein n=1 Tax=Bacillus sp. J14TS2 TaxID=2807188 RepID=UPI001B23F672|nr:extracellular solute-binding protein [Bacillus sp. J14TS2]GIN70552.1 putative ABC transporter peptide-binding protein YtcQ [Bacillus sp. J14TS2]